MEKGGGEGFSKQQIPLNPPLSKGEVVINNSFDLIICNGLLGGRSQQSDSALEECQQVGVELVLVRIREAVGGARVDL